MHNKAVITRKASKADLRSIVALSSALFQEDAGHRDPFMNLRWPEEEGEEYYAGIISGLDSVCLVVEVGGSIAGFLTGYLHERTSLRPVALAEMESMFVIQEFRGQGVGTHLVNSFLKWCQTRGAQRVSVTAYSDNAGAIAFYNALGFEPRNLTLEQGVSVCRRKDLGSNGKDPMV